MKTASNDLFQLIQSLSKQEKRYFKLHASRHVIGEQNKYVLLFDAIERQSYYDEVKLKEHFREEAFVHQFHVLKNYLYHLILDSLRNYHETKSGDKFYSWMRNARLLFDRGLFEQSEKALDKARKLAQEQEHFLQLLEVYRWEHQMMHSQNKLDELETYVTQGIKEEFEVLEKYRNLLEFQALNDRVFIPYWRKGAIRNENEKQQLQALFERPLFQSPEGALSFYARYFYFNARFSFHYLLGQAEESYRHIRNLVNIFDSLAPSQLKGRLVRNYVSALINLYSVQQQLGRFDEIPATLQKLRHIPTESKEQEEKLFIRSINLETDFYISTGQFRFGITQVAEAIQKLPGYLKNINKQQRLGLFYNLAYLYFGAQAYEKALDWINQLLQDPDLKTREDIHCFGRLLNLVIHYELGNDQLLEYIEKSTYRFLSTRKRLFKVESVMLKLMRRYPKWLSQEEKQQGFHELSLELEALRQDEFECKAFDYFNFTAWMESKVKAASFESLVVKSRAGV
ncbi:MAG: hypothetical protein R2828_23895 [Saprospiraceae bacterium]